jgi:hypothetical protein
MGFKERCWEDVDSKFRWEDNIKISLMIEFRKAWTVGLGGRIILHWVDVKRAWNVGLHGRIILKWVLWKDVRRAWSVGFRGDNIKMGLEERS